MVGFPYPIERDLFHSHVSISFVGIPSSCFHRFRMDVSSGSSVSNEASQRNPMPMRKRGSVSLWRETNPPSAPRTVDSLPRRHASWWSLGSGSRSIAWTLRSEFVRGTHPVGVRKFLTFAFEASSGIARALARGRAASSLPGLRKARLSFVARGIEHLEEDSGSWRSRTARARGRLSEWTSGPRSLRYLAC